MPLPTIDTTKQPCPPELLCQPIRFLTLLLRTAVLCDRVALPEGATREDVKLVITPENYVRVSFATEGRRSIYKDVRLPKDALLSEISAKFVAEQQQQQQQQEKSAAEDGEGSSTAEQGVSSLEIKVGRELPQASKRIDIM